MGCEILKPITVAVSALIYDNNILLIKRKKQPYAGYWALPGGKIEAGEHIKDAALREIKEETGITADYVKLNGSFSELINGGKKEYTSFLVFVSTLKPHHNNQIEGDEGKLSWFDLDNIKQYKNNILPSDFLIIKEMIIGKNGTYFECDMKQAGDKYEMIRFEKIN